MWGYHRNPSWNWEYAAADGLAGLVIVAVILAAAITITVVVLIVREIGRIYVDHAFQRDNTTAQVLWVNAAGLVAGLLLAAGVDAIPGGSSVAAVIALSTWTVFCIVAEVCGHTATSRQKEDGRALDQLDTYLDFHADSFAPLHSTESQPARGLAVKTG